MADSQLPRFQVFLQEKPGLPYQDVGSVHAPDSELALQNARDVFVRRPECNALWVVPASAIYSRTIQELEAEESESANQRISDGEEGSESANQRISDGELYYIFAKQRSAGTQTLVGDVQASTPRGAMETALVLFGKIKAFAWWVFPSRLVTANMPEDSESFFAPARDKPFRLSTDFHILTAMRALRKGSSE